MGFGKPSALQMIDSDVPSMALSSFGSTIQRGGTGGWEWENVLELFCYSFSN